MGFNNLDCFLEWGASTRIRPAHIRERRFSSTWIVSGWRGSSAGLARNHVRAGWNEAGVEALIGYGKIRSALETSDDAKVSPRFLAAVLLRVK